jgi:hypothetical protein
MSSPDRILHVLFNIAIMIVSAYVLGAAAGLLGPISGLATTVFQDYRWEVILFSLVLFFLSMRFLYLGVFPVSNRQQAGFVHEGELGQIKVSLSALEQIAEQVVAKERSVKRAKIGIEVSSGGAVFRVKVATNGQQNLVELGQNLQQAIRSQVEQVTEVMVRDVEIQFSAVGSGPACPM